MDDTVVPLMHAIVCGINEALAGRGRPLPEDWESFSLVIGITDDGRYAEAYGYAYGADDTWVQEITVPPRSVKSEVKAFVDDRYPDGAARPVAVLLQLRLADGSYHVEFEDHDRARWQLTPQNRIVIQSELKPVFDSEADGPSDPVDVQDAAPEKAGTGATASSQDFAVAVAKQMVNLPWPDEADSNEHPTWKIEGITGRTAYGITHQMRLGTAVPRKQRALTPERLAAFDERFGSRHVFDMDALPDYDPTADDLDMRVVLATVVRNTGATRALWWQATRRRIVVAGIAEDLGGLAARLFKRPRPDTERITGLVIVPPEMLDAPSPKVTSSGGLAAQPPGGAKDAVTQQLGRPGVEDTWSAAAGSVLEFVDQNLKIAVMQELMDLDLLPRFDWWEFARSQGLDPEEHGTRTFGTAIPEAMAYVDAVAITPELAERVTSIKMEAGNDVYGELAFHWDGEDDLFDVRTLLDLAHLPNLRSAELLYDRNDPGPTLLAEIESARDRGIDVRHWDS